MQAINQNSLWCWQCAEGSTAWDRFNSGVGDQLWWYGNLADAYRIHAEAGRADPARAADLSSLVASRRAYS